MNWFIIILSFLSMVVMAILFRASIIKFLYRLRSKLQIHSLREAINEADKNKEETGRKNMVVFNSHSGKYEPLQKRILKAASRLNRNKSNKAMTEGRKKMMKAKKSRTFTNDRVKQIEKKSLYVTD